MEPVAGMVYFLPFQGSQCVSKCALIQRSSQHCPRCPPAFGDTMERGLQRTVGVFKIPSAMREIIGEDDIKVYEEWIRHKDLQNGAWPYGISHFRENP